MKLIFWLLTNVEGFQIDATGLDFCGSGHQIFLQCDRHDHENVKGMVMEMIKHSESTQSNKFFMFLQYF